MVGGGSSAFMRFTGVLISCFEASLPLLNETPFIHINLNPCSRPSESVKKSEGTVVGGLLVLVCGVVHST